MIKGGDPKSVQRHKAVILQCIRDADSSIRKRALALALGLCTRENVEAYVSS